MSRALYTANIILILCIGTILVKHVMLRSTTFIGNKTRKYVVSYYCNILIRHITAESALIVLTKEYRIFIVIAVPYMFVTIYSVITNIIKIVNILKETKEKIIVIHQIKKSLIKKSHVKLSDLKILTNYIEKAEFKVTKRDADKISKLLKENSIICKVYYYKTSNRVYGIEVLRYSKED